MGLASNVVAVKCIYMYVLSGRGRAPISAERGQRMGPAANERRGTESFKQKNERSYGSAQWFAPSRQPGRVCANEHVSLRSGFCPGVRSDCGRNLWQR